MKYTNTSVADTRQIRNFYVTSRGLKRSCDRLELLYLHYRSAYGYQTWQDREQTSGSHTQNVTIPLGHVVLRDHVKN